MILNYCVTDADVTEYLSVVTEQECVAVEKLGSGKNTLFSAKPYILLIDYDKNFTADAVMRCLNTELTGSKILYCLFFGRTYKKGYKELAEARAKEKNLVLYGNDFLYLDEEGKMKENELYKLRGTAEYIKDFRPFNNNSESGPVKPFLARRGVEALGNK